MSIVKMKDIAVEEKGRIELQQLQYFMEEIGGRIALKATEEKLIDSGVRTETVYRDGRPEEIEHPISEGIQIHYVTLPNFSNPWDFNEKAKAEKPEVFKDGMTIIQKYGKQGGTILKDHMEMLKLNDTVKLQNSFYWYRLRQQRTGFSRLYPVEIYEE